MRTIFDLYKALIPNIKNEEQSLKKLIEIEYNDIQYIKTTSMNKNYMFNDSISVKFYNLLKLNKEDFRKLILSVVKSTSNFDSLDPNNMLLMFLMRYFKALHDIKYLKMVYEIFLYKLYYPLFNTYFKYGVDESAFEYFVSTLSTKFEITKQDNIYKALDQLGRKNLETYSIYLEKEDEKSFLLLPVNTKSRINQFLKEIMKYYVVFIEKNKIHINASRDHEDDERGSFNDQIRNDNQVFHEYKNRLKMSILHDDLPPVMRKNILKLFKKSTEHDIEFIYNYLKYKDTDIDKISDVFVDNIDKSKDFNDSRQIHFLFDEAGKFKDTEFTIALDKILHNMGDAYKETPKSELVEKRKILILILHLFLLKAMNKK